MPRNGTGTYTLPVTAFVTGSVIISGDMNNDLTDIGLALTQSLATTGVSTMTGPVRLASGSVTAPGLTFNGFNGTGFYRGGANIFGIAVGSVSVGVINASATAIWGYDFVFSSAVAVASVVGVSGGITTSVTITGGLGVTGGLIVGFNGVPAVDQIQLADSNLKFDFDSGTAPRLQFDGTDLISYTRANNTLSHVVGGTALETINATRLFTTTKIQIPLITVSTTASAPANQAWLYAKNNSGKSRVVYRNENGAETYMGGPGYWETIATFTVTTSITNIDFEFSANYSRLLITGVSVSPNTTVLNALIVQAYNSADTGSFIYDGMNIGLANGVNDEVRTANGAPIRDPGTWNAQVPCSFTMEYINTNNVGYKGVSSHAASHGEQLIQAVVGIKSSVTDAAINTVSIFWLLGATFSGTFRVYGQVAN